MVDHPTLSSIGCQAITLIERLDLVEQRFLLHGVGDTKLVGTLEHQVLQIVSQARRLARIVLRTRTYGDIRLYARLFLINTQIHFQTIG